MIKLHTKTPSRHATLRAVGLAAACIVLLAACGRSGPGDGEAAASSQATEAPKAEPTPASPEPNTTPALDTDESPAADPEVPEIDYLTFAQGAVPIRIGGAGVDLGANFTHAVQFIDGNPLGRVFTDAVDPETDTEFVYELPALTTFARFAVPNIQETPSPSQTFTKEIEVFGSTTGPDGGWELFASATLQTHEQRGQVTDLPVVSTTPVRWIKLRLVGGIEILREKMFFEFSEIIGNGTQETLALVDYFTGIWDVAGPPIELKQDGPTVTGCYDRNAELKGTVTGNILRATGIAPDDSARSVFILAVVGESLLRGVRSSNGAPFRLYTGPTAPEGTATDCSEIPPPELGCGSIIHGINFDFDSAQIRPDSEPVLQDLFEGLQADPSASIIIEGHTSSEGSDAYNRGLSERRARSVVEDLVRRGIDASRIRPVGKGEAEPIARNDDESGRSLNRRVEVECR